MVTDFQPDGPTIQIYDVVEIVGDFDSTRADLHPFSPQHWNGVFGRVKHVNEDGAQVVARFADATARGSVFVPFQYLRKVGR